MNIEQLATWPIFAKLDEQALQAIASLAQARSYTAGQIIIPEEAPCQNVFLIEQGFVRLYQLSAEGREHVLAYLEPGSLFGLIPILDGQETLATAEALTDVSLCVFPGEQFLMLMRRHPDLALEVARSLARQVRQLSIAVKDLALYPARARLARFLLSHAESIPPYQRWTQERIATRIGTVRDVVGRLLRAFAQEGLIRRERGRLVIVDRDTLEKIAISEDNR